MSQDCLSREPNAIFPTLRSRSIFFRNNSSKQKKIYLSARELHDECSTSVSVETICFEYLQQGSYRKVYFEIFLQDYLQPNALQVAIMMSLWKMITVFRSRPKVFYKKGVLRNFAKFTGKHLCQRLF